MKGYWQGAVDVADAIIRIEQIVDQFPKLLRNMPEEELLRFPEPGAWSKKQIIGHLVDSAINNLGRFTEAQFSPHPYIIQSYKQDELVTVNHYQELPMDHLLGLWQLINRQIIYVLNAMPEEQRYCRVQPSSSSGETVTLGWLICDYTGHMEHHLRQAVKISL